MNKSVVLLYAVVAALAAVPVFASESAADKDDCLVYGKGCPNVVDSLPERIAKLENEISKGREIYTEEELNRLHQKLSNDKQTLRLLKKP